MDTSAISTIILFCWRLTACEVSVTTDKNASKKVNATEELWMNTSMGNITAGDRITGGSKARVTDYAFYARVIIDKRYCGGTIINTLEVVTAAHCVFNDNAMKWFQPGQIEVRTGDFTLTKTTQVDIKKSQKHSVMQFQYLDQYRGNPIIGYDFVVLRLSSMIHFDKYRKALEPCTGFTANSRGNSLMAVGLGYTDGVRQTKAITLMKVALTEVNAVMCETAYPGNSAPKGSYVCTQDTGGRDTCKGDSGGPLFVVGKDGLSAICLYGVTSYGPEGLQNCGKGLPTVYARVSYYLEMTKKSNDSKVRSDERTAIKNTAVYFELEHSRILSTFFIVQTLVNLSPYKNSKKETI